jgi:hypothetical protein
MSRARTTVLVIALGLLAARPAAAQYLDPGAGSVVIQVIIAGVVGAAAVIRFYWTKITSVFARGARKPPQS